MQSPEALEFTFQVQILPKPKLGLHLLSAPIRMPWLRVQLGNWQKTKVKRFGTLRIAINRQRMIRQIQEEFSYNLEVFHCIISKNNWLELLGLVVMELNKMKLLHWPVPLDSKLLRTFEVEILMLMWQIRCHYCRHDANLSARCK